MLTSLIIALVLSSSVAVGGGLHDLFPREDLFSGFDLHNFVSRPDIRAPRFNVTKHRPNLINPGYWFLAPYTILDTVPDRSEYLPNQVGPHIYDGDGNLIWSGASLSHNRNAFDFRTFEANGSTFLSYILQHSQRPGDEGQSGFGVYLDSSYRRKGYFTRPDIVPFNFHELHIHENGTKVLLVSTESSEREDLVSKTKGVIVHDCIKELDFKTRATLYEWCPMDHGVTLNESLHTMPDLPTKTGWGAPWDFFHGNSIHKFANGDYLFSARHASTIYRVSRQSGSIVWRLGGKFSDFSMDFNFSSQHHAQVISEDDNKVVLTLVDNAADDFGRQAQTANTSAVKMVMIDSEKKNATLMTSWYRPDGGISARRCNANMMPNGNIFIGWSERGYISEHTKDNKLVLEAKFLSSRFGTYRTFKSNFTGVPLETPALKSFTVGSHNKSAFHMTTAFISWNGATEVTKYNFYGSQNASNAFNFIGKAQKTGFETVFSEQGVWKYLYAEAVAKNGTVLARSDIQTSQNLTRSSSAQNERIISSSSNADLAVAAAGAVCITLAMEIAVVCCCVFAKRGRRVYQVMLATWLSVSEDKESLLSSKDSSDLYDLDAQKR